MDEGGDRKRSTDAGSGEALDAALGGIDLPHLGLIHYVTSVNSQTGALLAPIVRGPELFEISGSPDRTSPCQNGLHHIRDINWTFDASMGGDLGGSGSALRGKVEGREAEAVLRHMDPGIPGRLLDRLAPGGLNRAAGSGPDSWDGWCSRRI